MKYNFLSSFTFAFTLTSGLRIGSMVLIKILTSLVLSEELALMLDTLKIF